MAEYNTYFEFDHNTLGRIEGLLEAWCDYGSNINWDLHVLGRQPHDTLEKPVISQETHEYRQYRLRELFNILSRPFIVERMKNGTQNDKELLQTLAKL